MKKVIIALTVAAVLILFPSSSLLAAQLSGHKAHCDISQGISEVDRIGGVAIETAEKNVNKVLEQQKLTADEKQRKKLVEKSLKLIKSGKKTYRQVFGNVYFMGDSLMNGLEVYGILNPSRLITQVSASLSHLEANMDRIIAARPPVLILHYGLNMISTSDAQLNRFISKYSGLITRLKKSLPNTRIIVSLIFPVDTAKATAPRFTAVGKYNKAIIKMCNKQKVEYLDSSSVVKANKKLQAKDGIHFAKNFYYEWLRFIMKDKEIY